MPRFPELPQEFDDRVSLLLSYLVVTMLLPAAGHLGVREPGIGVYAQRGERVGNRRGGEVRR